MKPQRNKQLWLVKEGKVSLDKVSELYQKNSCKLSHQRRMFIKEVGSKSRAGIFSRDFQ
jgi:hypothetical protein